jgi:hypothetical protein
MLTGREPVGKNRVVELVVARNPDPDSSLAFLLHVPLGDGLVFRTSGTWPDTKALYCYPVPLSEWPMDPDVVERLALRSCRRRGAAIDLVADRARRSRSQIVFTTARGRDAVFWQSPRTRRTARPQVRTPTARAGGQPELQVIVDAHERYAWRFNRSGVSTTTRELPAGDYGVEVRGQLVAAVERKSVEDLSTSVTNGRLGYQLAALAGLPRAAVVVEDRYSQIFKLTHARPATVVDGLAEAQVRWPNVPIVFCETRSLAEDWAYRFLAAAQTWAADESASAARVGSHDDGLAHAPTAPEPTTAEVRAWARAHGLQVPDRGRLRPEIWQAWRDHAVADEEP